VSVPANGRGETLIKGELFLTNEALRGRPLGEDLLGEDLLGEDLLGEDFLGEDLLGEYLLGEDLLGEDLLGEDFLGEYLLGEYLLGEYLLGEYLLGELDFPDKSEQASINTLASTAYMIELSLASIMLSASLNSSDFVYLINLEKDFLPSSVHLLQFPKDEQLL
jgi:hypothetical protein